MKKVLIFSMLQIVTIDIFADDGGYVQITSPKNAPSTVTVVAGAVDTNCTSRSCESVMGGFYENEGLPSCSVSAGQTGRYHAIMNPATLDAYGCFTIGDKNGNTCSYTYRYTDGKNMFVANPTCNNQPQFYGAVNTISPNTVGITLLFGSTSEKSKH